MKFEQSKPIKFILPKFEIGERVWMVCSPNHSALVEIRGFQATIFKNSSDDLEAYTEQAKINIWITDDWFNDMEDDIIPFKYMTRDEEEAKRWMKPWTGELTDDEWFKMIGKRPSVEEIIKAVKGGKFDSEESLEESELGSCCATLAEIRNVFIKCRDRGEITGWERELLQELVNGNHDRNEDTPLLDKVLKQLDVIWKE